jgi:endonuclease G
LPEFNRGIWKKLEDTTRGWALSRQHPILIIAGPIYNQKQDKSIGKNFVTVPHAFYKIVVDTVTNETQVFVFPHAGSSEDLNSFITSLAEVQKQTGIVFRLPKDLKLTSLWEVNVKSATKAKDIACAIN